MGHLDSRVEIFRRFGQGRERGAIAGCVAGGALDSDRASRGVTQPGCDLAERRGMFDYDGV